MSKHDGTTSLLVVSLSASCDGSLWRCYNERSKLEDTRRVPLDVMTERSVNILEDLLIRKHDVGNPAGSPSIPPLLCFLDASPYHKRRRPWSPCPSPRSSPPHMHHPPDLVKKPATSLSLSLLPFRFTPSPIPGGGGGIRHLGGSWVMAFVLAGIRFPTARALGLSTRSGLPSQRRGGANLSPVSKK
ncbi:hypothetical protein B296_00048463 [Ensete ventricosum]|uniref:Uncharacterized protein n=1 Tax=Ensete ventricosum TaxID=4639 RepID=A0A426YUL3_ENSVE|nr:hypothetical protein B296_00048463 [Ensete ventricosum]